MQRYHAFVLAFLALGAPLGAQRLAESQIAAAPRAPSALEVLPSLTGPRSDALVNTAAMTYTGALGGVVGILVGGYLGYQLSGCAGKEYFCGLAEALIGGTVGEVIMLPYGAHLSGKRTKLGAKVGVAALVAVAGIVTAPVTGGVSLLAIPPVQLIATIGMERRAVERSHQQDNQEAP